MSVLICPVCSAPLTKIDKSYRCTVGHCFDIAKDGYVNLLLANRHSSKNPGDSPEMARARHAFLEKGYFGFLAEGLAEMTSRITPGGGTVLDACCGEGYYTDIIKRRTGLDVYAFDISKAMLRLAAKRNSGVNCFVAGLNNVPVADNCVDTLIHIFAPFEEREFYRVLKNGGKAISVTPGRTHLFGLKQLLYTSPYYNEENPEDINLLRVLETVRLKETIKLQNSEDITELYGMTPYSYKTAQSASELLSKMNSLETEADFMITVYQKQM